jgi:hypothetical protein
LIFNLSVPFVAVEIADGDVMAMPARCPIADAARREI